MSRDWRPATGRPDANAGGRDVEYFNGWAVSGLMALATIRLVWHFQI